MKRIDKRFSSLRDTSFAKKTYLTFVYAPKLLQMTSSNLPVCRALAYTVLITVLATHSFPTTAQNSNYSLPKTATYFYNKATNDSLSYETKKSLLKIAMALNKNEPHDTIKYWIYSKIAVAASMLQDSLSFQKANTKAYLLAKSLKNKRLIADAHWNFGAHYLKGEKYDSSYYHYDRAYKLFTAIDKTYYAGKMLYNLAYICGKNKDLTGAEVLLFQAIDNFEKLAKNKQLYLSYNQLGTLADDLEEYEKALEYYHKASKYIPLLENAKYYEIELWNNMGVLFQKLNKQHEAISYFNSALSNTKALNNRFTLYAKLLDNLAYSYFLLGHRKNILEPIKTSLQIRDSLDDTPGSVVSRKHLAIIYAKWGDTLKAVQYAQNAYTVAEASHYNRDVLALLELLASIDKKNDAKYLNKHIALSNNLYHKERNIRNKFTAIRYETKSYIIENQRLFKERLWIIGFAIATTLLLLFVYLNNRQRAKNKALIFEREQQQNNEDMFLMALEQKTNLERGKRQERLRMARDLHDGIISKMIGLRFKIEQVYYSQGDGTQKIEKKHIQQLESVEDEIRHISHDLKHNDAWDELKFLEVIENNIKEKSEIGNFKYSFIKDKQELWEAMEYITKINISRMLDEILQNIHKHAKAKNVSICFEVETNQFVIAICDDGKGFKRTTHSKGIGLKNLKERSEKFSGSIAIESKIGRGTFIKITIPKNS